MKGFDCKTLQKLHMDPISTAGGGGSPLSLFSFYGQWLPRYALILKIAIFEHEAWNLKKVPEIAYGPSLPSWGWNSAYFRSMGSGFRDTVRFSKLPYLGMESGMWKSARSCLWAVFLPQEVEIEVIFSLRVAVSEIWADFKTAIFGHETWNLKKVPEVVYVPSFYPRGVEIELIFALRAAGSQL